MSNPAAAYDSIIASVLASAQGGFGWRSVGNGVNRFWGSAAAPRTSGSATLGTSTEPWGAAYVQSLTSTGPAITAGTGTEITVNTTGELRQGV